jgi:transportin-1
VNLCAVDCVQSDVLNAMITKFIALFQTPEASHRAGAVYCIKQFIFHLPNAFLVNLQAFLNGLLGMHKDGSAEVRKEICSSLCQLVEVKADFLADDSIRQFVVEFLLWTTENDSDYDVKVEACEFWSSICENEDVPDGVLKPYLTRLTLVLLNGMVYSEDELSTLAEELENKEAEINPAMLHAHSKSGVSGGDEDDEDEDDEDDDGGRTGRCASALHLGSTRSRATTRPTFWRRCYHTSTQSCRTGTGVCRSRPCSRWARWQKGAPRGSRSAATSGNLCRSS